MIRKLANEVWKLDGRVNKLELKDPDLVRGLKPVLVSLRDMLKEREVEFVDRTGHEFDPDELWDDVVGAQSSAGSAVITKMVRPRIMYRGSLLQRGVCQVESKE